VKREPMHRRSGDVCLRQIEQVDASGNGRST